MSDSNPKPPTEPSDKLAKQEAYVHEIATLRRVGGAPLTAMDFEPTDLEGLVRIAGLISRSKIAPAVYHGDPETTLLVLWKGRERGLSVMRSIELIYPFQSSKGPQVAYAAALLYGQVQSSGKCLYMTLVESTAEQATYETHRKGEPAPVRVGYTLAEAKLAGLLDKDNWKRNQTAMLIARAQTKTCRAVYNDVVGGVYTRDEIEEGAAIDVTPVEPSTAPKVLEAGAQKAIERVKRGSRRVKAPLAAGPLPPPPVLPGEASAPKETVSPPAAAAGAEPLLSPDQIEALLQRAEAVRYGGEGWVAFRAWVPKTYKLRLELLPASKYDELLAEIDEYAASAAPQPVGDLEGGE